MEFEYAIPKEDTLTLLDELCELPLIEKTRYIIEVEGIKWEIDEFQSENKGLVVAEVEMTDANQTIDKFPYWIGKEVSDDPRYFNSNLIKHAYTKW